MDRQLTVYEAIQVFIAIMMPIIIFMLAAAQKSRDRAFADANKRIDKIDKFMDHFDECLDDLKEKVASNTDSRNEIGKQALETQMMLTRMREQMGRETQGLHDRLMRLEDIRLKERTG